MFLWSAITAVANAGGDTVAISVNTAIQLYLIIYIILGIFGIVLIILNIIKKDEKYTKWILFALTIAFYIFTIEFLINYIPIILGGYLIWFIFLRIYVYMILLSNTIVLLGVLFKIVSTK